MVLLYLDGEALKHAEAADDGDVVGRQGEGELVHHVAQLVDHVLEVQLAHTAALPKTHTHD